MTKESNYITNHIHKSNPNPFPNSNPTTEQHVTWRNSKQSTKYSHTSVSREIHTRQCCCTVCTTFQCNRTSAVYSVLLTRSHWQCFSLFHSLLIISLTTTDGEQIFLTESYPTQLIRCSISQIRDESVNEQCFVSQTTDWRKSFSIDERWWDVDGIV